jgi:putative ABC transport system substrate-binding protein
LNRRAFIAGALALVAAPLAAVDAQQAARLPRIGVLCPGGCDIPPWKDFLGGLRDLGYVEGQTVAFEWRDGQGRIERFPDLAADLVRSGVEVIVVLGSRTAHAAKGATSTIPIIMAASANAVEEGLVASLSHPGGNVTGLSFNVSALSGKQLELLKEAVPRISRVAILGCPAVPAGELMWNEVQRVASPLRLKLLHLDVSGPDQIERAFQTMKRERVEGLATLSCASANVPTTGAGILTAAIKAKLPAVYPLREYVESGGLMSYQAIPDFRRAATYADRILKGTKPADLPVEQPTKFELVINLKTTKALGLTIPQSLLLRADHLIE